MGAREEAAAGAKRRHPDVEAYVARVAFPARGLTADLRALVLATAKDARESLCYGVPFFFVDGIAFCYVSPARQHVTFGFTMGGGIHDASGRLVGTGRSPIRKVALALDEPVPADATDWIVQAARLARAAVTPRLPDRPPRGAGSSSRTPPSGARRSTRRP